MRFGGIAAAGIVGLSVVAAGGTARGQEAQEPPAGLTDIIVTSDKTRSSVQDVPISITALTGDVLTAAGIQTTEQLSDLTPGLLVQRSVVGKISIRGVGNENYTIAGDPGVAVHSDGVYVARAGAGLFDLFDIDRVEVLRGPQGTLYGRNATGGVINVIPNAPADKFEAYLSAEYGNYDQIRGEGMVNAPLGDGWSVRVAALGNLRDGFTRDTFPGLAQRGLSRLDSKDVWAVRGQAAFDDGGPFKLRLTVEHIDDNSNLPAYKYLNRPTALPTADFGGFGPSGLRTVDEGFENQINGTGRTVGDFFKTLQTGVSLHASYDFDGATLSSITGFRRTQFNYFDDGDGSNVYYVNYLQQDQSTQWSQELQLNSTTPGPLQWLAGAYFLRETGTEFIALPFPFGANLPFHITSQGGADTTAYAAFGELRYNATDRLKLTVGGRLSYEERGAAYTYLVDFGAPSIVTPNEAAIYRAFTPRFVIDYALTEHIGAYVSATRGYKSGGFNLLAVQPNFKPETIWAYEGGLKTQTEDHRLTLNGDFFYYDYRDQQVGQIVNLSSVLTNAATSRVYGAEVEVRAAPFTGMELGGSAAWLDAQYEGFCTGDPTKPNAAPSGQCPAADPIQLAGNTLPRSPKWTLTGYASYTHDMGDLGLLNLRGDMRYQSRIYFTQFNRPLISQGDYATVNVSLGWTSANSRYTVTGFVENLFDRTYFSEVLESGAFNPQLVGQAYVAPPRTYGVRASVKF